MTTRMRIQYIVDRALEDDEYTGFVSIDDGDGGTERFQNYLWSDLIDLVSGMAQDCVPERIYVRVGSGRAQELPDDTVARLCAGEWRSDEPLIGG